MRLLLCVLLLLPWSASMSETIKVASLYWPPYSGAQLEGQGASIAVLRAALKTQGIMLDVDFYPWTRTVALAKNEQSPYVGYGPEYYAPSIEAEFEFTASIGGSPLGFMQRSDHPVQWTTLTDLSAFRVGVVRDYVNTIEFDYAVARGQLKVDAVVDDLSNLKKLIYKRLDLAVIDSNVLSYLFATDKTVHRYRGIIEMNSQLLETKQLFFCFRKGRDNERLLKKINQGLKQIDANAIFQDYLKRNLE